MFLSVPVFPVRLLLPCFGLGSRDTALQAAGRPRQRRAPELAASLESCASDEAHLSAHLISLSQFFFSSLPRTRSGGRKRPRVAPHAGYEYPAAPAALQPPSRAPASRAGELTATAVRRPLRCRALNHPAPPVPRPPLPPLLAVGTRTRAARRRPGSGGLG